MDHKKINFGMPLTGIEEREMILKVLDGTQYVHGPMADQFEQEFAERIGVKHAVSVSSCTAGLHLSLHIQNIGQGDKVVVPAMSHVATAHSVEYQQAEPLFIDINPKTGNIDLEKLADTIARDKKIKAINLVHYLGLPVDIHQIKNIAKDHDILIVEDCALAVDAKLGSTKVGGVGDVGCFSFYPVKHLTTGEGGMVTTNDTDIFNKIKRMKAFGYDRTLGQRKTPGIYDVVDLGYNYRMSEFHAAIGLAQIKKLDGFMQKRQDNFTYLYNKLAEIDEIYIPFDHDKKFKSAFYCLNIVLPKNQMFKRNEMIEFLSAQNIGVSVHYPNAIPLLTYYKQKYRYRDQDFPNAKWYGDATISLPIGPHLYTHDMDIIADKVKKAIQTLKITAD
ncbi:MAG: DegT/DnrJ/EryC1/StrS aminotransferase family protein [Pseudomonadota bacterium]